MHELVPEHHLLSEEEAQQVLATFLDEEGKPISRDKLPKIKKSDAAIKVLEKALQAERGASFEIREGDIIRIKRKSETACEFTAYRLVIKG